MPRLHELGHVARAGSTWRLPRGAMGKKVVKNTEQRERALNDAETGDILSSRLQKDRYSQSCKNMSFNIMSAGRRPVLKGKDD